MNTVVAAPDSQRQDFYRKLDAVDAAPLWTVLSKLITTEPQPAYAPAHWSYPRMRELLLESGELITEREAERRVLILENPGLRGLSQITQSLYAGLQIILPGEVARSHRHAACALRLVIESNGAYTAVDGERVTMHPGDFILTPSWSFHDHGNLGDQPAVWLDGLDVPMVNLFTTSFFEPHPQEEQPVVRPQGDALARYGAGLLPLEYRSKSPTSPLFIYPYDRTRDALYTLSRSNDPHACHGYKMMYTNPATGGATMPTISAFAQLLPRGFQGLAYRATDGTVYCALEGSGSSRIGDQVITWNKHDVFVVPSWCPVSHQATEDAVLFSFSDRVAQQALGLWREQSPLPQRG